MSIETTAKTPWKDHLGDIPFTLEYFQGAMWEGVELQAKERPTAVAMDFMGKSITYRELMKNIEACARSLRTVGIRPGDSVTIAMPNCPQGIYMFYAVNMVGAVASMVHPLSSEKELEFYINESESVLVVTLDQFYHKIEAIRQNTGLINVLLLNLALSGTIVSILHTVNDSLSDVVKSDRTDILYGRDYINETLLGLKFKISEFSFFQTNSASAEVLYSTAREFIGDLTEGGKPDKTVFDLYSGTGTITQLMAPVCKKIIGVEIVDEAVEAAVENATLNGIDNCEFICGDVLKALDDISEKPDFIILDPPRDGIHPKAITKILDYGVDRILYISCKATSLTRDLEIIHEAGYKVTRAACVDQFPWTANIETLVCLEKTK